ITAVVKALGNWCRRSLRRSRRRRVPARLATPNGIDPIRRRFLRLMSFPPHIGGLSPRLRPGVVPPTRAGGSSPPQVLLEASRPLGATPGKVESVRRAAFLVAAAIASLGLRASTASASTTQVSITSKSPEAVAAYREARNLLDNVRVT